MAGQPNKRRKVQRLTDWANARYSVMPPDAARDPNLTLAHMRLLGELGRVNTQHGWCEFSQKDVAAQMGGVRQTVSAAMNDLVRWRYVEMRDQKQTKSPFCHYRVLIDDPYFEAELEYIERHDHDPDDVSSGDDTPQTGDVSPGDDTPQTGGVVQGRHTCRLGTTPPINRNARASRSEINNPPTPRKRGKREGEIDDLLNELRRIPERQRAVEVLFDPLLRQRRFDAPDKVFALGQLADWASKHPDDVLADGLRRTLATRDVTVRPSDIEKALKEAIAQRRKLAPNRRATPSQLAHADPEVVAKGDQVRHGLKAELGADVFESWFQGIEFERITGGRLIASVPVKFTKSWIENHFMPALKKCSAAVFSGIETVDVRVRAREIGASGSTTPPGAGGAARHSKQTRQSQGARS